MPIKQADLDAVVAHLGAGGTVDSFLEAHGVEPKKYTDLTSCYRCWQVKAERVPASCIVRYNPGTTHAWTSPSCSPCLERDLKNLPGNVIKISDALPAQIQE